MDQDEPGVCASDEGRQRYTHDPNGSRHSRLVDRKRKNLAEDLELLRWTELAQRGLTPLGLAVGLTNAEDWPTSQNKSGLDKRIGDNAQVDRPLDIRGAKRVSEDLPSEFLRVIKLMLMHTEGSWAFCREMGDPAFLYGDYEDLDSSQQHIFVYTRTFDESKFLAVLNFSKQQIEYTLPPALNAGILKLGKYRTTTRVSPPSLACLGCEGLSAVAKCLSSSPRRPKQNVAYSESCWTAGLRRDPTRTTTAPRASHGSFCSLVIVFI